MLTSLLVIAISVTFVLEEAMTRLAHHISLLTGAGWVIDLLAWHPMHIHTELGVSQETSIALIEELCGTGHSNFQFVLLENNWLFFSMQVSQGSMFSTWVRCFKDLMTPFQSIQIVFISKYWCWKLFRYFKKMIIVFSSPPFCTNHVSPQNPTIQNSGHILKMQLVSHFPSASPSYHRPFYQDCKRSVTQNCLFACSFAFKIIYVLTSQKDTAADVLQKGLLLLLEGNIYLEMQEFQPAQSFLHHTGV